MQIELVVFYFVPLLLLVAFGFLCWALWKAGILGKIVLALIAGWVIHSILSNEPTRSATYLEPRSNLAISLELFHMHPYLAEYDRDLVLRREGLEIRRQSLFPDTGGYAAANLYSCGANRILVADYFGSWLINLEDATVEKGNCSEKNRVFLGAFDGAGSQPWKFYLASERQERSLEARGG